MSGLKNVQCNIIFRLIFRPFFIEMSPWFCYSLISRHGPVHQASRKVGCKCTDDSCILHKYIIEVTAVKLQAKSKSWYNGWFWTTCVSPWFIFPLTKSHNLWNINKNFPTKFWHFFIDYCLMFARFIVKINRWLLRKFSFYNKTTLRAIFSKLRYWG